MKRLLIGVWVVLYFLIGIGFAAWLNTRVSLPDPFAFLTVVFWPIIAVVCGVGLLVRGL